MKIYILVLIQVFMLVSGQTLWKYGIDRFGELNRFNFINCLFSPPIIGGLGIYVLATFLWFYILSIAKDKFSMVYPMGSLAYIFGVFVAYLVFKEAVPATRWIGVVITALGILLIARQ